MGRQAHGFFFYFFLDSRLRGNDGCFQLRPIPFGGGGNKRCQWRLIHAARPDSGFIPIRLFCVHRLPKSNLREGINLGL